MESDSDSDGSHISSTPPRQPNPPSPLWKPSILSKQSKPSTSISSLQTLVCSYKSRTKIRVRVSSSRQTLISKPKPKPKPKRKTPIREANSEPRKEVVEQNSLQKPLPTPDLNKVETLIQEAKSEPAETELVEDKLNKVEVCGLAVKFLCPSDRAQNDSTNNSIDEIPINFCSKTAFFSKIKKPYSIPEELSEEDRVVVPERSSQPEISGSQGGEGGGTTKVQLNSQESNREEGLCGGYFGKVGKRFPDFIGGGENPVPVKRPKAVNEGNFVRLNINGYGHSKFKYKNGKKHGSYSSYSKRSRWRSKSKPKAGGEGEDRDLFDEDGLISEAPQFQEQEGSEFGNELVEQAVLAVRNEPSEENLTKLLKLSHGYDSFRGGQLQAIKQVISGESTMLVLPTGAGKSLCYQLAALILKGLILVVSPLVALMIDQLRQLPPMIPGNLLSSNQTYEEASETVQLLVEGKIKVLFVSPERFLNANFLAMIEAQPLLSLVVVDEAHCLSEWSHNFRPSYLRLTASLLRTRLKAQCILAMTATATTKTLRGVMVALDIPTTNLIMMTQIRENLQLSVTSSVNRMKNLIVLMKSPPFVEIKSVIVYCKFQFETDLLSKYLRDNNINAKSYHSGIPAKDRSRTQEMFCSNKLRVVVATVAFGMGLDKSDVGAVIHYSLPESLEEYVQEVGRAGRDGRLSYCHLFYDEATYFKLRSLSYSDGVDDYAVKRFLSQVFSNDSLGKVCSLIKDSVSRKFDMKEEVILTILTHLELGEVQYLRLLPPLSVTCTLYFHKTPPAILAGKDSVVAEILKRSETKQGPFTFDIPSVANAIGITAIDLSKQLLSLKSKGEITYETKDPSYCYTIVKSPADVCSLASQLTRWLSEVESCKVRKLDAMVDAVKFATNQCDKTDGCSSTLHTKCLQRRILEYFSRDDNDANCDNPTTMGGGSRFLRADIKVFLQSNSHNKFTPRAVARIMHGIPSPSYPSAIWSKTHFWGRYSQLHFPIVMEAAKAELMNFAGKDVV